MNLIRTSIPHGEDVTRMAPLDVETTRTLIAAHRGPVIVDFDETLYLRNSTEDFLDSARPGWLAKIHPERPRHHQAVALHRWKRDPGQLARRRARPAAAVDMAPVA